MKVHMKNVGLSVQEDEDGRLKLDPGASWIHEGPPLCPLPFRCLTGIVPLESSASLCSNAA